jgi:hypothetical protein
VVDNYYATNPHELIGERTFFRSQEKWTVREEGWLLRQAEAFSIDYISPHAVMCNNAGCLARIGANGSDLTAFDTGHMTVAGSTYLAKAILPLLLGNQPN